MLFFSMIFDTFGGVQISLFMTRIIDAALSINPEHTSCFSLWYVEWVDLIKEIWHIFGEASFYVIFGIFVSGLIQIFIDKDSIAKHLGNRSFKSVFLATICGIPLPLCSCGVIPTAIFLRKNGASKGATLSFLISTPETGIDSISISYALLDPIMTIFRPFAAFISAMMAGICENIFGKKDNQVYKQSNSCIFCEDNDEAHKHGFFHRFKYSMHYAFIDLLGDISKWLILGIIVAGAISYFVPQNLLEKYMGYGWQSMFIMLAVGIPLYICASASTPIAAALILKGLNPGAALVFLLAGPATNIAGILAVAKFLGKRSVVIYLISISICSITLGLLLNSIYQIFGIDIKTTLGKAGEALPDYLKIISAIALVILMTNAYLKVKRKSCLRELP